MIRASGRNLTTPEVTATPMDGGLLLRVENADDEEFWCELFLAETDLLQLLVKVHELTHVKGRRLASETRRFDGTY